jgi:hypothetical protein
MYIMNNPRWLTCSVLLAGVLAFAGLLCADEGGATSKPATEADPRVMPGETFYLEFPKLPKTRHNEVAKMQVCIPKQYDPQKQYPLYAWIAGGDGSSSVDTTLVNADLYIRVALPFPKGAIDPHFEGAVGRFPQMWLYHKAMLDELHRVVPNISPSLRILAGFSNGAHTVAGFLYLPRSEFPDYFNVYVPVEGGWIGRKGGLDVRLKDRYICFLWGDKSINSYSEIPLAGACEKFGMRVTTFTMEDTGHEFPATYQDKVRDWIKNKAVSGMIDEAIPAIEKAQGGAAVGWAYGLAKSLEVAAQEGKDADRIGKQLARLEEAAGKQFADLKATVSEKGGVPTASAAVLARLKSFMKEFRGTASSGLCRDLLGRLGGPELDKIKAGFAKEMTVDQRLKAAGKLKQFGRDWEGTAPADEANRILQDLSEQAFSAFKAGLGDDADEAARKKALPEVRKFMTLWEGTAGAAKAKVILDKIASKAFEKIQSASTGSLTEAKRDALAASIVKFQAEWKDAQAASDAQTLLDDLAQREFDEYKATWPASMTRPQAQAVVGQLKKLQAKWRGTSTADFCDDEIVKLGNVR